MTMTSEDAYQELCKVIPGGVNSPARAFNSVGGDPLVVDRAQGDMITDVEGCSFIDYCGSWGALILGHAHPEILQAVQEQAAKGTSFGITTPIEGELAQAIVNIIDSIEKVRFVSSGTEATMSAIRLARGFTGRDLIVKFNGNYHGHADFFLVKAGSGVSSLSASSSAGIPEAVVEHVFSLPYNDIETCRTILHNHAIAAVILEPIAGNMGVVPASKPFIQMLREETTKTGALLIFDEVISGFRVALKGAQSLYGVKPDLTCLGKIIGGGFPAAAFGGRSDIMEHLAPNGPVYQAGTLSGNPVAMRAGLEVLQRLQEPGFYEELEANTRLLTDPIEQFLQESQLPIGLQRVGSMFTLFFGKQKVHNFEEASTLDSNVFAHFFRHMLQNGVYIPPSQHEAWFVSAAHTPKHLEKTKDLVLSYLKQA